MGVTRFPNGVEVGNSTTAADLTIGGTTIYPVNAGAGAHAKLVAGTIIVGATGSTAFIPSGLTSATWAVASPYGALSSTAGTVGGFVGVTASVSGGTVTLRGYDQMGTASSNAGTAIYFAYGT